MAQHCMGEGGGGEVKEGKLLLPSPFEIGKATETPFRVKCLD